MLSTIGAEDLPQLASTLDRVSRSGERALQAAFPASTIVGLFNELRTRLEAQPTLVEVQPSCPDAKVTVVGDTHGQFHDVVTLIRLSGYPSAGNHMVFNGDFVDRGAWGLEVLILLAAWKLAMPQNVTLLRGNHESTTCTRLYGFHAEMQAKYGSAAQGIFAAAKRVFAALPLAARIAGNTLVLHGGLFRKPSPVAPGASKGRKRRRIPLADAGPLQPGNLSDLMAASKGGADPDGTGSTAVAADILWSDPGAEAGLTTNDARGVGLVFGPDITQRFLEENALQLILRSHEGPDARYLITDPAKNMRRGYSLDHDTSAGQLYTVFSAPDYPQFQDEAAELRYNNLGAVAVLSSPNWSVPHFLQYEADLPRPAAKPYYDIDIPGSDEEVDLGPASSCEASNASEGSALGSHAVSHDAAESQPQAGSSQLGRADVAALSDVEVAEAFCDLRHARSSPHGAAAPDYAPGAAEAAAAAANLLSPPAASQPAEPPAIQLPAAEAVPGLGPCETHVSPAAAAPVKQPELPEAEQLSTASTVDNLGAHVVAQMAYQLAGGDLAAAISELPQASAAQPASPKLQDGFSEHHTFGQPNEAEGAGQPAAETQGTALDPADSQALYTARAVSDHGAPAAAQALQKRANSKNAASGSPPAAAASKPAGSAALSGAVEPVEPSAEGAGLRAKAGALPARGLRSQTAAGLNAVRPWR